MASRLDFSQIRSLYIGTSSSATVDTNNLIVSGNVGVGTTSPAYKLDVDSGSSLSAARFYNSSNAATVVWIGDTGNSDYSDLILQSNSGTGEIFKSGTGYTSWGGTLALNIYNSNGAIAFHPNNTANAMFIATSGNVGIGTTAPTRKLQITDGEVYVRFNPTAVAGTYILGAADGKFYVIPESTFVPTMTFSSGNVGIGTTSPASPLQISAASVLSQGVLSVVNTYASGGVYYPAARFVNQRGDHSFGIVSEFYTGATSGSDRPSILFNTGNSSNSWQVGMVTSGWGGNDSFGIGYRANNDPASFNAWPTARFLITTDGNVGIGTTAPQLTNAGRGNITINGSAESIAVLSISDAWKSYWFVNGSATYLASEGNRPLYLESGGGVRVSILGSGYVGIDNTSPGSLLTVGTQSSGTAGSGVAQDNSIVGRFGAANTAGRVTALTIANTATPTVGNDATLSFIVGGNYSATGLISSILQNTSTARTDMAFSVYNVDGNYERMRITGGGNVGIGTTSPGQKLSVNGSVESLADGLGEGGQIILRSAPSGTRRWNIDNYSTSNELRLFTEADSDGSAGAVKVLITEAGNVGIGTTSPFGRLNISRNGINEGTISFDDQASNAHLVLAGADSLVRMQLGTYNNGSYGAWIQASYDNGGVNYGTEPLILNPQGNNVGIGTTSPSNRLTVYQGGGVRVTGIASGDWIEMSGNLPGYTDNQYPVIKSNGTIHFANNNKYSAFLEGANTYFGILDSTTTTRVFLTTSGNSYLTGGNVGINTTAPFSKLQVGGNTFSGGNGMYANDRVGISNHGSLTGLMLASTYDDASYPEYGLVFVQGPNTSSYNVWSISPDGPAKGDGLSFIYGLNATNIHSTTPKVYFDGNGSVGIGTTSPNQRLSVEGGSIQMNANNAAANYYLFLNKKNGQDGGILFNRDNGNDWQLTNVTNNGNLLFYSYGTATEAITFTKATGNVLIGTSTDSGRRLRVIGGNAEFRFDQTSTVSYTYFRNYASGGGVSLFLGTATDDDQSAELLFNNNQVYLQSYGDPNSYINFGTRDASTSDIRMRINPSGLVGIGTTSPFSRLDVATTATEALVIGNQSGTISNGDLLGAISFASRDGSTYSSGGITNIRSYATADYNTGSVSGDMRFYVSSSLQNTTQSTLFGTEAMRIASSGNVGIGNTSPSARLDLGSGYGASGEKFFIYNDDSSSALAGTKVGFYMDRFSLSNNATFVFPTDSSYPGSYIIASKNTSSTTLVARVTVLGESGNVGIGTTSPASVGSYRVLDIQGSSGGMMYLSSNGLDGGRIYGNSGGLNYDATAANHIWYTPGGERMRISSAGNVGIGTTAPDTPLSSARGIVINSGASNDVQIRMQNNTTGSAGSDGGLLSISGSQMYLWNYEASNLIFGTNNSERMRIDSSGNIGIGTTSISYRVDISGDARILSGSLGVGVAPNATDGRIDASNDIVAYSTSDQRLKENVTPIENALEKIKTLTGVEFDWKEETAHVHGYHGHDVGIIAQDVQAVLPEAVRTNESGYLSVRYEKMIALLIEGMKEQQNQIDELKAKLNGLTR